MAVFRSGAEVTKYQGPREAAAIVKFMKKQAALLSLPSRTLMTWRSSVKLMTLSLSVSSRTKTVNLLLLTPRSLNKCALSSVSLPCRNSLQLQGRSSCPLQEVWWRWSCFSWEDCHCWNFGQIRCSWVNSFDCWNWTWKLCQVHWFRYSHGLLLLRWWRKKEQFTPAVQAAAKAVKGKVNTVFINGASTVNTLKSSIWLKNGLLYQFTTWLLIWSIPSQVWKDHCWNPH